jgi:hypothetical protein
MRAFDILGIVLFRFAMLPRIWAIALILVNAASLAFVHTIYGQANLAAVLAAIAVMVVIHARFGYVRLLGVGHVFWIPMIAWFVTDLPDRSAEPALYHWVVTLVLFNSACLVVDAVDLARFIAGERNPHYVWKPPDSA